jgi:hypothetical protein
MNVAPPAVTEVGLMPMREGEGLLIANARGTEALPSGFETVT